MSGHTLKDHNKDRVLEWWVYLVVGLVSLVLLLTSPLFAAEWPVFTHFLQEVGFAGIISLIVIFTIERFSRSRHERAAHALVEKMNNDLFHAIYKRYIPEEVFVEVEKCLMQSGVFRRGHDVNYTIQNIDEDDVDVDCNMHVKCLAQSRYILHNITKREVSHPVILMLERPVDPKWDNHCKIKSVKINGVKLSDKEIEDSTKKTEAQFVFCRDVIIPPSGTLEVVTSASLLKQKADSEIWASRLPSDGMKLTVSMPSKDIKVFAKALHSEKLVSILDNNVTKSWELKHGMFPFQSIVFWWHS